MERGSRSMRIVPEQAKAIQPKNQAALSVGWKGRG
jgi:hypothetical protein